MSDTDENLLTAAKLREQVLGDLDGDDRLKPHAGFIGNRHDRRVLSFVDDVLQEERDERVDESEIGELVMTNLLTDEATRALKEQDFASLANIVGVTEQDFDGSAVAVSYRLAGELVNNDAPAFLNAAGDPETGKTNTMLKCVDLYDQVVAREFEEEDDVLVIANFDSSRTDIVVRSAYDLAITLLEHRDRPKVVIIDEASTHFDAGTYRYEVRSQWTPLAKRFAKLGVHWSGLIVHSGKDLHPECKRLGTLSFWKYEKKILDFFAEWSSDADMPTDPLFPDPIEDWGATWQDYDPDDSAPWAWNLPTDLFQKDLTWDDLLDWLRDRGPAD